MRRRASSVRQQSRMSTSRLRVAWPRDGSATRALGRVTLKRGGRATWPAASVACSCIRLSSCAVIAHGAFVAIFGQGFADGIPVLPIRMIFSPGDTRSHLAAMLAKLAFFHGKGALSAIALSSRASVSYLAGAVCCCSSTFLRASSARRRSSSCSFFCCSSNTLGSVGGPS
jgi:hypothetical protein